MSSTASAAANGPPSDEVQRQWDEVTTEARSRWETLRTQRREHRLGRRRG